MKYIVGNSVLKITAQLQQSVYSKEKKTIFFVMKIQQIMSSSLKNDYIELYTII